MTASEERYWSHLGATSRVTTALRVAPAYAWHLVVKPYRRDLPIGHLASGSERWRGRHAGAALDMWVASFLGAFGDMAGLRLDRQSGSLAIRYIRLMAAINKEFEHRLAAAKSLALPEILSNPVVKRCHREWEDYATRRMLPADVVSFMNLPDFVDDYSHYVSVTTRPGFEVDVQSQLESILLDSGGYLTRLARLVAESRGGKPREVVLRSCFNLGVAAKFADDLADVRADHREGRYNLLLALLTAEPTEHKAFVHADKHQAPLTVDWWCAFAPGSFAEFTREFLRYYRQIGSAGFETLCDLAMLRCLNGSSQRPTTRATRTVTEPPLDPWR
jgi:hypothetical protein